MDAHYTIYFNTGNKYNKIKAIILIFQIILNIFQWILLCLNFDLFT